MRLSIIVPAYNEEKLLGACLKSVREAVAFLGGRLAGDPGPVRGRPSFEAELIVCDNNSTDATGRIAREGGAAVVFEPVNLISRSRDTGAGAATGDWLLFIDADSRLSAGTLAAVLEAAREGKVVGGGCLIAFDRCPWWGKLLIESWNGLSRAFDLAAGSLVFCRADAFRAVGGFPADIAAGEELALSRALKAWGKAHGLGFTVLTGHRHVSSGRKFALYSPREFLEVGLAMSLNPRRAMHDPSLDRMHYDGRR